MITGKNQAGSVTFKVQICFTEHHALFFEILIKKILCQKCL